MNDQELVKSCLHKICKSNGFSEPAKMIQRDFELISQKIEQKTNTLISVSTIKRLLSGDFSRLPQTATLNAISNYIGFSHWQEYKLSVIVPSAEIKLESNQPNLLPKNNFKTFLNPLKWLGFSAIAVGFIVLFNFVRLFPKPTLNAEKAEFSLKKTTDNSIPNTVVFNYNIDKVNADSFFIQQSWDKNRRVRIYKNAYTLTDIYYEPGYHRAKLYANDSIIKVVDISIPTDKWFFLAKNSLFESKPEYIINPAKEVKSGSLALDKNDLETAQIKSDVEKLFAYLYFPTTIEVSSDNYVFRARVRVNPVRDNPCPYLMCEIYTQKYFNFLRSTSKGCASETFSEFGENYLRGKNVDLSATCYDVTQWTDIEIRVINKQATVYLNHVPVFSTTYTISSGLLTGLGFISNGLCEVQSVELKGINGEIVYQNKF